MLRTVQLTTILVVVCYFTVYVLVYQGSRPGIVVEVQSDPSVLEMSEIIQQQREQIEHLSKHPKVIIRCPDDESKIQYPRHASEDLTEIVMDTNDECGNESIDAVVIVHTAADHFQRRERFRRTYANFSNTKPYRLKVVFLIGSVLDAHLQIKLELENREYGDTVVGAFLDTYQNLTLKAVMGFRWLTNTCQNPKLIIKMDDDVFFDVRKFFISYWEKSHESVKKNHIHCLVWQNAHVGRTGKWKVEKNLFANASYPFPYCAGFFAVVTPDLVKPIYNYGKAIDFFWIDDVFLYGMVPVAVKDVRFVQLGGKSRALTQNYKEFRACKDKMAGNCPFWAVLTNGENEFDQEYRALISSKLTTNTTQTSKSAVLPAVTKQSKLLPPDSLKKEDLRNKTIKNTGLLEVKDKNNINNKGNLQIR